jgi:hypothetical protein
MRDFNITPLMLQQKFKVSMDGIEYIPIQDSYMISTRARRNDERRRCAVS